MHLEKVRVQGFRLLEDVEIIFESGSTVIVGRNNSGKTSLTDVFDRLLGEQQGRLRLEDFSAGIRERFYTAKQLRDNQAETSTVLAELPKISLTLTVRYNPADAGYGPLEPFVIDLDEASNFAVIRLEYAPSERSLPALLDIPAKEGDGDDMHWFYQCLRESLPKAYSLRLTAVDPTGPTNKAAFDSLSPLSALVQCGVVRAQRTLDHAKHGETDVIGKLLGTLYHTATSETAAEADRILAGQLKASVTSIERSIQTEFDNMVSGLLPALEAFGFPSLNDTELRPETSLNVESLLSDHTRIRYTGTHGVHLPEGYNGLGTRNLIYMLLQLEAFHKAYRARPLRPGIHLVFIEEPEAHLHPQMQEVFIAQLATAVAALSQRYPNDPVWRVQFIVSTHASHVANAASFDAIRYFLSAPKADGNRQTKVKDFRKGLDTIPAEDRDFLHQYMTLTKCDIYFADKVILIEGTTERILMPRICRIVDEELASENKLARQYLTTVEVGGAYAEKFYDLLDFLELKSLFITDLDAVYLDTANQPARWKKCPCINGTRTSNQAIKSWFNAAEGDQLPLADLAAKTPEQKTRGFGRIAYQVPEPGADACARSYEDAFILANPAIYPVPENVEPSVYAWEQAQEFKKTENALRYAIRELEWNVPHYIREGLLWLSEPLPAPQEPPPLEPVVAPPPEEPEAITQPVDEPA